MSEVERYKALRSRHIVRPSTMAWGVRCEVDRVKVNPVKGGWRHDISEVRQLAERAHAEGLPVHG